MTIKFATIKGATPISTDEVHNLIPAHITTQEELNEWEQNNILQAEQWAFNKHKEDILNIWFVKKLHKKMFNSTWKWAGLFRTYQTNIGCDSAYITQELASAFNDAEYQLQKNVYGTREIGVRLHHKIVWVHPFPNGNGRLARLFVDLFLFNQNEPRFTWGSQNLTKSGKIRAAYLTALKAADKGELSPLITFADS